MVNIVIYLYIIILKDNISPLIKYCGFYTTIQEARNQINGYIGNNNIYRSNKNLQHIYDNFDNLIGNWND